MGIRELVVGKEGKALFPLSEAEPISIVWVRERDTLATHVGHGKLRPALIIKHQIGMHVIECNWEKRRLHYRPKKVPN